MTKLYITEYQSLQSATINGTGIVQAPLEPPLAEQVVDYTSGVAQSAAFNPKTTMVRLNTDAVCSILFGTNPVAATSNQRMSANQTEYKQVGRGLNYKVSAITNT